MLVLPCLVLYLSICSSLAALLVPALQAVYYSLTPSIGSPNSVPTVICNRKMRRVPLPQPCSKSTATLRPIASSPTLPIQRGELSTPFAGTAPLSNLAYGSSARRHDTMRLGHWMERELDKLRTDQACQGMS